MRYDEPRLVWTRLTTTGTREEPGTLTQGAPVFPGPGSSSRLGIEPKTPGWLVQDPATSQPIGGSDPNHQGIWSPPRRGSPDFVEAYIYVLLYQVKMFPSHSWYWIKIRQNIFLVQDM